MEKIFIKNRHDKKIAALVDKPEISRGLAFITHGLGGIKSAPHLQALVPVLLANHYVVVRFDATHTYGESEGDYSEATATNYYQDLEDVINWAMTQSWYAEPFILIGHSLGGLCSNLYAINFSNRVKALATVATVVSGDLFNNDCNPQERAEWERTGWQIRDSHSQPGIVKRLRWLNFIGDLKQYDLLDKASKLVMPKLLIVGEQDDVCSLNTQNIFFENLPEPKELQVIKDAPHTFKELEHLAEMSHIVNQWLKSLN